MEMLGIPEKMYRWLGYGDIHSPLWFIGIEPGGDLKGYEKINELDDNPLGNNLYCLDPNLPSNSKSTKVWDNCKYIAEKVGINHYFLSNMSPIPHSSLQVNQQADLEKLESYQNLLYLAYQAQKTKPIVIFHGKGVRGSRGFYKYKFHEKFNLGKASEILKIKNSTDTIHKFGDTKIILCRNLSSRASNAVKDAVCEIVSVCYKT